jgi:Cys-tRNA(Pro) deacylase
VSAPAAAVAAAALGVAHSVVQHGRVNSAAEAAEAQGVALGDLVKTIVVRRAADSYVFVLVPGDRQISWPKLRAHLGVNRLSLPDAATAFSATGYERGTITPFGSSTAWPVIADSSVHGHTISLGAGVHGVGLRVLADDAVRALGGVFADVTDPIVR